MQGDLLQEMHTAATPIRFFVRLLGTEMLGGIAGKVGMYLWNIS